jgi:hypothetical protein
MYNYEKKYHEPKREAVERFIDSSPAYDDKSYRFNENEFYLEITELAEAGWDFYRIVDYHRANESIRYLKGQGYKVKVINKNRKVLIFYRRRQ